MSGQSRKIATANARRVRSTVQRAEQQPYPTAPDRRAPRPGAPGPVYYCAPSAAIAGAGAPPSGTISSLASQTVYQIVSGAWSALSGTYTVYNPYPAGVAITKVCSLAPNGAGGFNVLAQSCT